MDTLYTLTVKVSLKFHPLDLAHDGQRLPEQFPVLGERAGRLPAFVAFAAASEAGGFWAAFRCAAWAFLSAARSRMAPSTVSEE